MEKTMAMTVFLVTYTIPEKKKPALYILLDREGAGDTLLELVRLSEGRPVQVEAQQFTEAEYEEITSLICEKAKKRGSEIILIDSPDMLPDR